MSAVDEAARAVFNAHDTARVRRWARRLQAGELPSTLGAFVELARGEGWSTEAAALYLLGRCDGLDDSWRTQSVQPTWTGPASAVPVRATATVLEDLIRDARYELVIMTYSAKPHPAITAALQDAHSRGVITDVVVETLKGAAGAISGSEPAAAFAPVPGIRLWHWPIDQRGKPSAKMHAKLAIADRRAVLLSSANLTQSGVSDNLEAGVVIKGGTAPGRCLEYVRQLQTTGQLRRLKLGGVAGTMAP